MRQLKSLSKYNELVMDKNLELEKYRDLVLATIDYYLENKKLKTVEGYDAIEHFKNLKKEAQIFYEKGRLAKLKNWFRDLTEMQIETRDFKFSKYLKENTKYDIDIFEKWFARLDKIILKGKISSDSQFYDVKNFVVNEHANNIEKSKFETLNKLLEEYEFRKLK